MEFGVSCYIKNQKLGKYLFTLREDKPNIAYPNHWNLVGGGRNPAESPIEAMLREIREEVAGIKVYNLRQIMELVRNIEHHRPRQVLVVLFKAETDSNISDIIRIEEKLPRFFYLNEISKREDIVPLIRKLGTYPDIF